SHGPSHAWSRRPPPLRGDGRSAPPRQHARRAGAARAAGLRVRAPVDRAGAEGAGGKEGLKPEVARRDDGDGPHPRRSASTGLSHDALRAGRTPPSRPTNATSTRAAATTVPSMVKENACSVKVAQLVVPVFTPCSGIIARRPSAPPRVERASASQRKP